MSDTLIAGRELDALVAEKVMGQRVVTTQEECTHATVGSYWDHGMECYVVDCDWIVPADAPEDASPDIDDVLPAYSTDIAAAWDVVEKISGFVTKRDKPWWSVAAYYAQRGQVGCRVYACPPGSTIFDANDVIAEAVGDSAPHAICLAALHAVGAA